MITPCLHFDCDNRSSFGYCKSTYCINMKYNRQKIDELKPADVAPVVRCRDCSHYYFADNRIPQEQRYVCEISGEIWKPDSFCSYGEKREE